MTTAPDVQQFRMRDGLQDPWLGFVLVLAALFLFFGLGDRTVWQDEAETAIYARSILQHGVPRGFDGVNWATQVSGRDLDVDGTVKPYFSPWIQFYVAAAGIAVFGETDLGPRAFFPVFGILSVWFLYGLARRLGLSLTVARLSALTLTICVPFLVHVRQARGYAIVVCLTIALMYFLFDRRKSALWAAAVGVLLFYTNHVFFFGVMASFLAGATVFEPRRDLIGRFSKACGLMALPILPGLAVILRQMMEIEVRREFQVDFSSSGLGSGLTTYLKEICTYLFPPGAFFVFFIGTCRRTSLFLGVVILVYLTLLSPLRPHIFRYLMPVVPFLALLIAMAGEAAIRWRPRPGVVLSVILLFTNILHLYPAEWLGWTYPRRPASGLPHGVTVPVFYYMKELTTHFRGPNWAAVDFFKNFGQKGQTVVTPYGDLPLQYHTPLRVVGSKQGRPLDGDETPEWILLRFGFESPEVIEVHRFIFTRIDFRNYVALRLPSVNLLFGNIPAPHLRFYEAPEEGMPLTVFARKDIFQRHAARLAGYDPLPALQFLAALTRKSRAGLSE